MDELRYLCNVETRQDSCGTGAAPLVVDSLIIRASYLPLSLSFSLFPISSASDPFSLCL